MDADCFRLELAGRLEAWAERILLRIVPSAGAEPVELTGRQILDQSRQLARRFTAAAPPGSVVLLLFPHSVELFVLHIGLIVEGRLPAILAWPTSRVDAEKYQRNLLHQLRKLPAAVLVTLPRLAANLGPGLPYAVAACEIADAEAHERHFAARLNIDEAPPVVPARPAGDPGPALFLQFSGGTTGAQKCVVVTAPMMEAQMRRLRETLQFTEADGAVSWLPLYHDMGLIACFWFPLWHGAPSTQMAASDWLLDPGRLLSDLDRYRATFCWLPNFAFSYLAGARERMKGGPYSLGHVRALVNCSEPVRLQSMRAFAAAFADWGVRPERCQASYAMAETVFAVTQTPLGATPRTFPRGQLRGALAPMSFDVADEVYVSSGRLLGGSEIAIRTAAGTLCAEAEPGEIFLRSESQFNGYWGVDGFTRHALVEGGWYATGDYGFVEGGELFVIGRLKDIIIVGGQNIFPEDVELLVNGAPGVYAGRVVAFGITDEVNGTEALAVVAELRGEFDAVRATALEREIRRLVLATIGIAPRWVAVTPERWIVKSTAGKISRRDTRQRFLQERLAPASPQPKG